MNKEQEQQLIDFTPNMVSLLHQAGFTREQAAEAVHSALACLFGTIWKIPANVELTDDEKLLLTVVQVRALNMFYGSEVVA